MQVSSTASKPDLDAMQQRSRLVYRAASTYVHETLSRVRSSRTRCHLFQGMHEHAFSRQG
jgi:hypothetical protein